MIVQVIYPFLESKVRNVTSAYSVEHEDEVGHVLHSHASDFGIDRLSKSMNK